MITRSFSRYMPIYAECGGDPSVDVHMGIRYTEEITLDLSSDLREAARLLDTNEAHARQLLESAAQMGVSVPHAYWDVGNQFVAQVRGDTVRLHWCYHPGAGK